jgi:dienelactone hydrolase
MKRAVGLLLSALIALRAAGAGSEPVRFANAEGTMVKAHWLPIAGDAPRPAVVALHGCGGLYRRDGTTLDVRYTDYAARFAAAGYHTLLPDSFGSRGSGSICTVRNSERTITAEMRGADVLAAVQWLGQRADVDARRIVIVGWSHGAMTLLHAVNAASAGAAPVAGAIAFYPGCRALLEQPFRVQAPLLLLLGEKDDWTPPARCEALVARTLEGRGEAPITLKVYPDSYHGFDSRQPVRFRADVPNGVNRAGVHQGGNPQAREQALLEVDRFLARILQ